MTTKTEKKCPIHLDPRTACRDCQFNKSGCNFEEFKTQFINNEIADSMLDYWLHLAEGAH